MGAHAKDPEPQPTWSCLLLSPRMDALSPASWPEAPRDRSNSEGRCPVGTQIPESQPSLQGTSHTDSGLRLQNCSGLSPGFSPREEPALAASFHLPARPLWECTKLTPPEPRLPTGAVKARSAKKTLPDQSWGLSRHQHSRHDRISGTLSPYCRLWSQHAASKQPPRFCKKKKKSET